MNDINTDRLIGPEKAMLRILRETLQSTADAYEREYIWVATFLAEANDKLIHIENLAKQEFRYDWRSTIAKHNDITSFECGDAYRKGWIDAMDEILKILHPLAQDKSKDNI